jgi:hypothetical protein
MVRALGFGLLVVVVRRRLVVVMVLSTGRMTKSMLGLSLTGENFEVGKKDVVIPSAG